MNGAVIHVVKALALNEVRLRMRRLSTMVALMATIALCWMLIPDQRSGQTLIAVEEARVIYNSACLAIGSVTFAGLFFPLIGFYLVRGRMAEDIRSGIGSVIGATAVGDAPFLFGRWLGGVAYVATLLTVYLATVMLCQLVRGDAHIVLWVYLQTYALAALPMILFSVSCAILFDSIPFLMGKFGDVLYFIFWVAELSLMAQVDGTPRGTLPSLLPLDFTGIASVMVAMRQHVATDHLSVGMSTFNATLAPYILPDNLWSWPLARVRVASMFLATLPLLPALFLFHRFSPDRVKVSSARARRSPLAVLDQLLRPLTRVVRPLFGLAARLPGIWGQTLADIAVTLVSSPSTILLIGVASVVAAFGKPAALGGALVGAVCAWGVLISDISTRDFQADIEDMTGAVPGGVKRRYLRQLIATLMIGALFMGVTALRWSVLEPQRALALVAGVFCLSALAMLFGRASRTARTFLALFLFGVYVSTQTKGAPMWDAVGFNGAANQVSTMFYAALGIAAVAAGVAVNRWRSN